MQFQKNITDSRKLIQCVCSSPIVKLSFDTKVGTLLHRKFSQKFLLPTLGRFEIRLLTPDRLKY